MVNHRAADQKNSILNTLRESSQPITGEYLGRQLGISRVAIHKHISFLRQSGYSIHSGNAGDILNDTEIPPFTSWEFQAVEGVTILNHVDSTMNAAHVLARKKRGIDFIIASLRQEKGRGCREKPWDSPPGGLWVTRVIHPGCTTLRIQLHVMAAAVALARLLREIGNLDARVKWPNDVVVNGKKIAGILGEAHVSGDQIDYLALGLGLNVNNSVPLSSATSLKRMTGREEDRRFLLRGWITCTDKLLNSTEFHQDGKPHWWTSLMYERESTVSIITEGRNLTGTVKGVDDLGRLRLCRSDGNEICLPAGSIESPINISSGNL